VSLLLISSFSCCKMWISSAFFYFITTIYHWSVKRRAICLVLVTLESIVFFSLVMFLVVIMCPSQPHGGCQLFLYRLRRYFPSLISLKFFVKRVGSWLECARERGTCERSSDTQVNIRYSVVGMINVIKCIHSHNRVVGPLSWWVWLVYIPVLILILVLNVY